MRTLLLSVVLRSEHEVVTARQRARDVAEALGFERQDQSRLATAVSEIARNAVSYARGGKVEFYVETSDAPAAAMAIHISDTGPGIPHLKEVLEGRYQSRTGMGQGIVGARRLMDHFEIESSTKGTSVWLRKHLPRRATAPSAKELQEIGARLEHHAPRGVFDELRQENQELLHAMEELRRRQEDLTRLNSELEETNRGVVALYAELDERAEQLKRAAHTKSRFFSHISHEFRTPLNSILALSRLLLEQTDGPLLPEQQKQVTFIRQSGETLLDIVNDLLDLARVEAGKTPIRPSQVDVASLFGTLRGMMRPLLTNPAVALVFEDPAGVPPIVTDEAKLAQILRNFLSNALKFTERGEVRLSARLLPGNGGAEFAVSDTGIGIAPENCERIFDEFVQVENPLQSRFKGSGLGLPLARKLAELMGGEVAVESRPGAGSTFTLRMPLVWPAEEPAAGTPPKAGPFKILMIDDEEISRYLLRQSLGLPATAVVEVDNGREGLAAARRERPAGIILDLRMPEMDGFEVLRRLQADEATRAIPVLVATSKSIRPEESTELQRLGAVVLNKAVLNGAHAHAELVAALARAGVPIETAGNSQSVVGYS